MATAPRHAAKPAAKPKTDTADAPDVEVDRVAMVSLDAEGNPAQSAGYVVLGEDD